MMLLPWTATPHVRAVARHAAADQPWLDEHATANFGMVAVDATEARVTGDLLTPKTLAAYERERRRSDTGDPASQ